MSLLRVGFASSLIRVLSSRSRALIRCLAGYPDTPPHALPTRPNQLAPVGRDGVTKSPQVHTGQLAPMVAVALLDSETSPPQICLPTRPTLYSEKILSDTIK